MPLEKTAMFFDGKIVMHSKKTRRKLVTFHESHGKYDGFVIQQGRYGKGEKSAITSDFNKNTVKNAGKEERSRNFFCVCRSAF